MRGGDESRWWRRRRSWEWLSGEREEKRRLIHAALLSVGLGVDLIHALPNREGKPKRALGKQAQIPSKKAKSIQNKVPRSDTQSSMSTQKPKLKTAYVAIASDVFSSLMSPTVSKRRELSLRYTLEVPLRLLRMVHD